MANPLLLQMKTRVIFQFSVTAAKPANLVSNFVFAVTTRVAGDSK